MKSNLIAKKAVSEKLANYSNMAFEELSGSRPSEKTAKLFKRNSKKLVKTIHAQIKKADRKLQKKLKSQETKKKKSKKVEAQPVI